MAMAIIGRSGEGAENRSSFGWSQPAGVAKEARRRPSNAARLMITIIFIIIIDIIEKNPLGAEGAARLPFCASAAQCRLPIKQDGGQSFDAGAGLARGRGEGGEERRALLSSRSRAWARTPLRVSRRARRGRRRWTEGRFAPHHSSPSALHHHHHGHHPSIPGRNGNRDGTIGSVCTK